MSNVSEVARRDELTRWLEAVQPAAGAVEAAEAIAFAEKGQQLYRAANGMKMCPDCDGRWIPGNQARCMPCANVTPCDDASCGCQR